MSDQLKFAEVYPFASPIANDTIKDLHSFKKKVNVV